IEADVIRWIADLFDFPADAQGILTTGGSLANFSAIVTAREVRPTGETIYVGDQAHHSITKAAALAGFPPSAMRVIASDGNLRMDLEALEAAVKQDPN